MMIVSLGPFIADVRWFSTLDTLIIQGDSVAGNLYVWYRYLSAAEFRWLGFFTKEALNGGL